MSCELTYVSGKMSNTLLQSHCSIMYCRWNERLPIFFILYLIKTDMYELPLLSKRDRERFAEHFNSNKTHTISFNGN